MKLKALKAEMKEYSVKQTLWQSRLREFLLVRQQIPCNGVHSGRLLLPDGKTFLLLWEGLLELLL